MPVGEARKILLKKQDDSFIIGEKRNMNKTKI